MLHLKAHTIFLSNGTWPILREVKVFKINLFFYPTICLLLINQSKFNLIILKI